MTPSLKDNEYFLVTDTRVTFVGSENISATAYFKGIKMLKNLAIKAHVAMLCRNVNKDERGITAIEYAIIGVAMSSALFFIFDKGGFIQSLSNAWQTMSYKITASGNILK